MQENVQYTVNNRSHSDGFFRCGFAFTTKPRMLRALYAQHSPNQPRESDHRMTNKKGLSERDICTKLIMPALKQAGWDMQKKVREEVGFTDGRIYVKRTFTAEGKRKRTDYIFDFKSNIPFAIIEQKDKKKRFRCLKKSAESISVECTITKSKAMLLYEILGPIIGYSGISAVFSCVPSREPLALEVEGWC
ncbi:hypothetical protein [Aliidiomarina indica]|uniref:hypothetical protein n=1 Tax=Aliidiomarina indica TaxID=2749147 RepID=UPI00188ECC21|nr:hypothetical protein [Aliidiomarina indica]